MRSAPAPATSRLVTRCSATFARVPAKAGAIAGRSTSRLASRICRRAAVDGRRHCGRHRVLQVGRDWEHAAPQRRPSGGHSGPTSRPGWVRTPASRAVARCRDPGYGGSPRAGRGSDSRAAGQLAVDFRCT